MAFVELSTLAQNDLSAIRRYIAEEGHTPNPDAADRTVVSILKAIKILEIFPKFGKLGRIEDTWELQMSAVPYFAIYRFVANDHIVVTAIFHDSRQYPPED